MKNKVLLLIILLVILLFSSCEKTSLSVSNQVAQVFMTTSKDMGFSFYVNANISDEDKSEIEITSPDKTLKWVSILQKKDFSGLTYYGSSDFMMPKNTVLPTGEYSYTLICKDGRTIDGTFVLSYQNESTVLDRVNSLSLPYFDSISNITVIN